VNAEANAAGRVGCRHLRRLLREYVDYDNAYRTYLRLNKAMPLGPAVQTGGKIISVTKLGGFQQGNVRM
jgi:hypothetical protein